MVSCAGAASGLDGSGAACRGWGLLAVLLMVAQLVVMFPMRPFTTLFSFVQAVVILALTILSALSQLVYIWAYANDTSGVWLVNASAGCSLAVVGLSAVNILLNGAQLWAAAVRRIETFRNRRVAPHALFIVSHNMMMGVERGDVRLLSSFAS
ncbi:membrane-associated protein, putative [Bodo saltans]|uniref:Membrane-associated protein, putative n=1 Tax=Bodo saltans TaxID=75058 RepID=A0A0S4IVI7_BODSA|nr:membrane-associated protein, putative [Bodo saltans]|eukprot:CUG19508.1 membrane-associated protein, putative [Bodo saltans]